MISKKLPILGINQDDTYALVDTKEYLNALNLRFTTSESGKVGQQSTVEGNVIKNTTLNVSGTSVAFVLPSGTNSTIGAYEDTPNKRIFFFNKNSGGSHGIYCYDSSVDKVYTVLLNSQIDGGLGFSTLIHSVAMIDNLIYWTDGINPQRRINVEAGIKTNHPTYTTTFLPYSTLFVGTITGGSSYTNGTYTNVALTGGTGSGAKATIVVAGNTVTSVIITYGGSGYAIGNSLTTANTNIGGAGSGFSVPVTGLKINQNVINLIRNQPAYPLIAEKQNDATYAGNNIAKEAFQFAYRFVYRDNEVSTFSSLSSLLNYNLDADNFNYIRINVPTSQKIDQDVQRIEIAVKYILGGQYNIVKTWDRSDNYQVIENHNNGNATALQYSFYNDSIGIAVDSVSAYKVFDSIPNTSETLEIAKNRLFLGNNTIGYTSPSSTSLTVSTSTYSATLTGVWAILTVSGVDIYLLDITGIGNTWSGYYAPGTYPATAYNYNSSDFRGAGIEDVLTYYGYTYENFVNGGSWTMTSIYPTITGSYPSPTSLTNSKVFKSDASYRLGVVFYDYAGRKCGVVTSESLKKTTVDRGYNVDNYTTAINWGLSNDSAVDQIPDWAYYYSVVMTKCLRTSFFIQMRATDVKYIKKDFTTGLYSTPTATYTDDIFGIAIKIDSLYKYGMGYTFNDGDVLNLYGSDNSKRILKVKDTYSDYVIVDPANLGTIVSYLFELYTPYSESSNEVYYEKGSMYAINNPGSTNRGYSTLLGSFSGDVLMLSRTVSTLTFLAESMSPNAINWSKWNTNIGRPNIVNKGKVTKRAVSICYSDTVILGTEINGLSTFEATSQYTLPYEMSSIQKLQLVSKVGAEGTVMLAVGEQETASIYLGEAQITDNSGNSFLATTTGVIGNVNVLRGSYGTINPESVVRHMGDVYWFDANKGAVVSYNANGLFPISSNKMQKYFRKVGQDVLKNSLRFYGGVDPYHNEILMFAPRQSVAPKGSRLTDMLLDSSTYNFTTTSSNSTITVIGNSTYPYSGAQLGPVSSTVTGSTGLVTYLYTGTGSTSYGPTAIRPSQNGSYQVVATVAPDVAYNGASSSPFAFSIFQATSTISVIGDTSYTYNGLQLGPISSTVTGSTGAVTYVYTGTGSTTYGPTSSRPTVVGTYQVVATVAADSTYSSATSSPFSFAIATVFVFDADYMLLTYQFSDGVDLDTRTRVVVPDIGQDLQTEYIGWAVSSVWPSSSSRILDWGGDNTGVGFESVLVNVALLKAQNPSATTMVVDLRAFWFNTVGVQPVTVAATLWKGGSPIAQGGYGSPAYSFTNPTALGTLNITSVGKQITSDGSPSKSSSSGQRVATLTYNLVNNTGSFNSNDTTTPSV